MFNSTTPCTSNIEGKAYTLFVILNVLSGFFATTGNVVVLLAVYKTRSLRTVSNFFICSLAVADLLVGLIVNPLYIAIVTLRVWVSDHPLYQAENYLWIQTLAMTTFSLAAISIDRYIAVTKVFRYQEILTKNRCFVTIGSVWAFSATFASATFVIAPGDSSKLWVACVVITVGIPLAIMTYCYYYIFQAAQSQSKKMRTNAAQITEITKQRKAAITVAIVVGLFVCLFTPNLVFSIFEVTATDYCQNVIVYQHWLRAIWLALSSSACNPWVYAIRNRDYREAYKRICNPICISA